MLNALDKYPCKIGLKCPERKQKIALYAISKQRIFVYFFWIGLVFASNYDWFSVLGKGRLHAKQKVRLNLNQRAIQPLANICWNPVSAHAIILICSLKF